MWIKRDLSDLLKGPGSLPAQIVLGPRQCGKSSLLAKLSTDTAKKAATFTEVTLDDFQLRKLAQSDPALFFEQNPPPLILDEAQYAPPLFPEIKRRIDLERRKTVRVPLLFRITGSNQLLLDRKIQESLAGRASFFRLHTLSIHEILGALPNTPIQEILFRGGWPELYVNREIECRAYLNDYIRTYLEKDILLEARIEKLTAFQTIVGLLAARTGELLNFNSLAKDAGISPITAKDWTNLVERSGLAYQLPPYATNLNKRLIKSAKFYFLDTGLATRLQGHQEPSPMMKSPQVGHLFETITMGEIVRTRDHFRKDWQLFFWRTKEGEEFDFLILAGQRAFVLDAQLSIQSARPITASPGLIKALADRDLKLAVVTFGGTRKMLTKECEQVPISELTKYLLDL